MQLHLVICQNNINHIVIITCCCNKSVFGTHCEDHGYWQSMESLHTLSVCYYLRTRSRIIHFPKKVFLKRAETISSWYWKQCRIIWSHQTYIHNVWLKWEVSREHASSTMVMDIYSWIPSFWTLYQRMSRFKLQPKICRLWDIV